MKYDKNQFIWDVINEAIALREHATKKERQRLDIEIIHAMSESRCIYGLMTGTCFSKRAAELISICCTRYFHPPAVSYGNYIDRVIGNANGIAVDNFIENRTNSCFFGETRYYSAIEAYITLPDSKIENLIAYLRGETKELNIYL